MDTQMTTLCIFFKPARPGAEDESILILKQVVAPIGKWVSEMRLKLNCGKTELIMFGHRRQLLKCKMESISLDSNLIQVSSRVKYLGGGLVSGLTFKKHISTVCGKAMANFFRIRSIRSYLNRSAAETLLLGLCISHLDYANSVLYALPVVYISKMQRVQSMCAKLVLNRNRYSSSTAALKELHWLPIRQRIVFKLVSLVYRCKTGTAPQYLKDLLISLPVTERQLRSTIDQTRLIIPKTKCKTFADRSFGVAAPGEWNLLPRAIREAQSYELFKKKISKLIYLD